MNDMYYSFGSLFKVNYRGHLCYKCGTRLYIIEHFKVVSRKSEEAEYYDFGGTIGPCRFIHEVFYCPKCRQNIEFVTQLNQEDIDILIKKTERYFLKKGRDIHIKKCFEDADGGIKESCDIESAKNLCICIEENSKDTLICKVPKSRFMCWERPYYFEVKKRKLIKFIKEAEA